MADAETKGANNLQAEDATNHAAAEGSDNQLKASVTTNDMPSVNISNSKDSEATGLQETAEDVQQDDEVEGGEKVDSSNDKKKGGGEVEDGQGEEMEVGEEDEEIDGDEESGDEGKTIKGSEEVQGKHCTLVLGQNVKIL